MDALDEKRDALEDERISLGAWCFPHSCPLILGTVELGQIRLGDRTTKGKGEINKKQLREFLKTTNKKFPNKNVDRFLNSSLGPDKFIGLEVSVDMKNRIWRVV